MSDRPINPDQLTDADLPVDFGRYTLTKVLGEGGMARVFLGNLAGPQGFRKSCAIKVLHADVARRGEKFLATLANEARIGGLLNHPNVVNTYDFGNVGGQPFIAMEFIDGLGIDQLLAEVRRPPPEITLELGIQMCAGLEYAHNIQVDGEAGNLVHRDLKPSNVILSRNGVLKVMDFGIAKASNMTGNLTGIGMTKGTPPFMSPEQMAAEDLDRRSDIFAMGSLLFEIATGTRLFNEASISAVISSVMNVDRTLREGIRLSPLDSIFPDLRPILERCLAPEREDRYSSARAMAADLKRLQRSMPMGESLEDYIQAVLRGDITPTPAGGGAAMASSLTADLPLPVQALPPMGTESVQIHFEESGETDTLEASIHKGGSAPAQQDRTTRLERRPPIVMEDASEAEAPVVEEPSEATAPEAPALSGGTLVIGRTDSRVAGQRDLNPVTPPKERARPRRGTTRRRKKVRRPRSLARRVAKWGIGLGLLLVVAAAVVLLVRPRGQDHEAQPAELPSSGTDSRDGQPAGPEGADGAKQGTTNRGSKSTRASQTNKGPTQSRKDKGTTTSASKASSAASDVPATTSSDRRPNRGNPTDRGTQGRLNSATSSSQNGADARSQISAGDGRTSSSGAALTTLSDEGPKAREDELGSQGRVLRLESVPKEFFGGKSTKAMFRISMLNHQSEDKFDIRMRMRCRSDGSQWRSYSLSQVARTRWEKAISLDDNDRGICMYYFTAQPKGETAKRSGEFSLRSRANPYTLKVR